MEDSLIHTNGPWAVLGVTSRVGSSFQKLTQNRDLAAKTASPRTWFVWESPEDIKGENWQASLTSAGNSWQGGISQNAARQRFASVCHYIILLLIGTRSF